MVKVVIIIGIFGEDHQETSAREQGGKKQKREVEREKKNRVCTYSLFSVFVSFAASLVRAPFCFSGSCSFSLLFLLKDPVLGLLIEFLPLREALLLSDPNHPSSSGSTLTGLN